MVSFRSLGLILLLTLAPNLLAQRIFRSSVELNTLYPQGYNRIGTEFWSAGGAGIADAGSPTAPIYNPAAMDFDRLTLTVEGLHKYKTEYLSPDFFMDDVSVAPSYVSLGIPLEPYAFAVGYYQSFNGHANYRTDQSYYLVQPGGIGDPTDLQTDTKVHTVFGSLRWRPVPWLALGATIGIDLVKERVIWGTDQSLDGSRFKLILASNMQLTDHVAMGISLQPSASTIVDEGNNPANGKLINGNILLPPEFEVNTPLRADIAFSISLLPEVRLSICADYQQWSGVSLSYEDRLNVRTGISVQPIAPVHLRMGYFTERSGDANRNFNDYLDQTYLTAGISVDFSPQCTVSVGYLTSRPFTADIPSKLTIPRLTETIPEYYPVTQSFHQSALNAGITISY